MRRTKGTKVTKNTEANIQVFDFVPIVIFVAIVTTARQHNYRWV